MKKLLILITISFNAFAGIEGTWESACGIEGKPKTTRNYRFSEGKVEAFYQEYGDVICFPDQKISTIALANGSYEAHIGPTWGRGGEYLNIVFDWGRGHEPKWIWVLNEMFEMDGVMYRRRPNSVSSL